MVMAKQRKIKIEPMDNVVFIDSEKVTVRSMLTGCVLVIRVANWLRDNVGNRSNETWDWFLNNNDTVGFVFVNQADAVHFKLVWGGDYGNSM